jgi:hypothetical protein
MRIARSHTSCLRAFMLLSRALRTSWVVAMQQCTNSLPSVIKSEHSARGVGGAPEDRLPLAREPALASAELGAGDGMAGCRIADGRRRAPEHAREGSGGREAGRGKEGEEAASILWHIDRDRPLAPGHRPLQESTGDGILLGDERPDVQAGPARSRQDEAQEAAARMREVRPCG